MPDGLRDRIRDAAEKNNRSMNAEIIERLEASFEFHEFAMEEQKINNSLLDIINKQNEMIERQTSYLEDLMNKKAGK